MTKNNDHNIVAKFIDKLHKIQHHFGADPYWQLIFSNGKTKWYYLNISLYNDIYYVSQRIGESANIEIHNNSEMIEGQSFGMSSNYIDIKYWNRIFGFAIENINSLIEDPLNAYLVLNKNYPTKFRQGIIQKALLWHFDRDFYRFDTDLAHNEISQYCQLVENNTLNEHSNKSIKNLTPNQYFELCKIAYISSGLKLNARQKKMSGRELYKLFADGRHDGLLDIDGNSTEEFNQWLNHTHSKYTGGGHPWEILRGGNTTHISLYVTKDTYGKENEFKISLAGHSSNRLCETVRIALGLYKNGYTVAINGADLIRNRLLGQDFIGIVPEYASLHRAEQLFETKLEDVIYYGDIKTKKQQLTELIKWEQLPYFSPK